MSRLLVIVMVLALVGVSSANQLPNSSFETYADDGYGRIMPTGYGLWTDGGNWGNIPNTQISTADALSGSASFKVDPGTGYSDVALTYGLGILPTGHYTLSGYVKGAGVLGGLGVDMFSPDWSQWWWGGSTSLSSSTADAWTKFSFDIDVSAAAQWNFIVKGYVGSAAFLVDDVSVTPEPATMGLLALGGLLLRKRK